MNNMICLVGRLTNEPMKEKLDEEKNAIMINVAVTRSFKNDCGVYENDFIPVVLWESRANSVCEYCHKGDLVGIKGRLQMKEDKIQVIAEKVSFLTPARRDED